VTDLNLSHLVKISQPDDWQKHASGFLEKAKEVAAGNIILTDTGVVMDRFQPIKFDMPKGPSAVDLAIQQWQQGQDPPNPDVAFAKNLIDCVLLGEERWDVGNRTRNRLNKLARKLDQDEIDMLKDLLASSSRMPGFVAAKNPLVEVKLSKIRPANWGLYAARPIKKGEYIGHYGGKRLTPEEYKKEYADRAMPYGFQVYIEDPDDPTGPGKLAGYVDGGKLAESGLIRFANHPLRENAAFTHVYHGKDREFKGIWLQAERDIDHGEEIYVDYGSEYQNQNAFMHLSGDRTSVV
jgi:hypothetical protein